MLVDIVFPGWVPFAYLAPAEDVCGYVQAHDIALTYDFDTFVREPTLQDLEQEMMSKYKKNS